MPTLRNIVKAVGYRIARLSEVGRPAGYIDLTGDRDVEWAWVAANLPESPGKVLDFGPATSSVGLIAAMKGGSVTGLDLSPQPVPFQVDNLSCVKGDLVNGGLSDEKFDTIINCSTVEHVGLGGRYGSVPETDGDLKAMKVLRSLMRGPDAIMILTIPVGRDGVYAPRHRVYGEERLPRLLEGFAPKREAYFAKTDGDNRWHEVSRAEGLSVRGSESFYGLGLFALAAA